ncbi:hypothetical protein MNBD_GAMMA24-1592 [hydrothermal vent metagenome]|uniref:Helix-turn-helix domain-containing protein n=1 Tax=hydrothermal vent metagenome TaxID=652676 RepID=A0A3B1BUZ4_9ZZZZ
MALAEDRRTLEEANIDVDDLISEAAAIVRQTDLFLRNPLTDALSEQEAAFLRRGGAVGLDEPLKDRSRKNIMVIASEYAEMVAHAYTQKEVADLLKVTTSRIRQRIDAGTLYSIESNRGRVCPRWQFSQAATLPGIERVLKAISSKAHPVAVQHFFLSISADLESPTLNQTLSPRDWLISGHNPDAVVILANEL